MNKPNILHLVEYLYLGGIERLLEQLAVNTKEKAHVHFFTYETLKLKGIGEQIEKKGFPVYTYKKKAGRDWALVKELIRVVKEQKIEVVHTHDFGPIEYAVLLKLRFPRLKLIHTQHTMGHFVSNRKYTLFFQLASYFYRRVIAVSQYVSDTIVAHCPWVKKSALKVIGNGVDTDIFNGPQGHQFSKEKLKLVSISRISQEKNLPYLLKTCALLKEQGVPFEFHHAGTSIRPEMIEDVHQYVRENGLAEQVFLHGYTNDAKSILDKADIFLSASHTEGHPVAVLEAMSSKKLCFCSDIDPHRELGTEAIVLFDKEDPKALAVKLARHFYGEEDFKAQERISYARDKVVAHYSIQTMVDKYVEQYQ